MSDWRHRAACRNTDPDLHFPIGSTGPALLQIEDAKDVCRRCVVRESCLTWAMEKGMEFGVWGGLSEEERRTLKRRTSRAAARLRSHKPEVQERALELFRTLRPKCPSNQAACEAVAARIGSETAKTVRVWAAEAGLIDPAPSVVDLEERRRLAVERFRAGRAGFRSAHAAHVAIAAEFGVHPDTVREWTRAVRHVSRVGVGGDA